jgi:hypothetical protein
VDVYTILDLTGNLLGNCGNPDQFSTQEYWVGRIPFLTPVETFWATVEIMISAHNSRVHVYTILDTTGNLLGDCGDHDQFSER